MGHHGGTEGLKGETDLSGAVIGAAVAVHRELGPGLLESSYEACLACELGLRDIPFRRQLRIPVLYKGLRLDCGYRADLLVADRLLVEVKSVEQLLPVHTAQLLTYLKLTGLATGLLLNFNTPRLHAGIRRVLKT